MRHAEIPQIDPVRTTAKVGGTIDYYCRFHPNMKATLTVGP